MAKQDREVGFDDAFLPEFAALDEAVQDKILARAGLPEQFGPPLPRPYADTRSGSAHANMKDLRAPAGSQVRRVVYAFDLERLRSCLVRAIRAAQTRRPSMRG